MKLWNIRNSLYFVGWCAESSPHQMTLSTGKQTMMAAHCSPVRHNGHFLNVELELCLCLGVDDWEVDS